MRSDYLDAGIGDVPGFSAEVWVETADLARAEAILSRHRDLSGQATEPEEAGLDQHGNDFRPQQ